LSEPAGSPSPQDYAPPLRTPLYGLHRELGARMVPFAGYEMPVQYPTGILAEHLQTRTRAGLFDVSHMGQVRLAGSGAALALETLVPVDVAGLAPGRQRYACFTNEAGGVLDDLMIANLGGTLHLVVNAACKAQDFALLGEGLSGRCEVQVLEDRALLALQGPQAAAVLARFAPTAATMSFMSVAELRVDGIACLVSRSGYTGEDGYELSVDASDVERLARLLLAQDGVAPIGLGARDSLRLEAGLCLYGHELDPTTTPVEAGIAWAIQKVRRPGGARAGGFPGAAGIFRQLETGPARCRVGFRPEGRAPVREGSVLLDAAGAEVGRVTSGGFGASVDAPIGMAYVAASSAAPGTRLQTLVRDRPRACVVAPLPFAPHRYFRNPS